MHACMLVFAREMDLHFLEAALGCLWRRHWQTIRSQGATVNSIRSAGDMYSCWPSSRWFGESALPFADHLDFEIGDSSYNVWVLDIHKSPSLLGRIVCDLFLRMEWPKRRSPEAAQWASAADEAAFVQLAAAPAREGSGDDWPLRSSDDWEFRLRSTRELMEQIWWRDDRAGHIRDAQFAEAAAGAGPQHPPGPGERLHDVGSV
mmetsp:Transcript_40445/g.125868  ORF Transcript_40445/g.125868 Transcript_40445/m.125868 type:complete len:204 (-) Transcript_40445:331-942(-)